MVLKASAAAMSSGGPSGRMRTLRSPAPSELAARPSRRRPHHAYAQPVGDQHRARGQHHGEPGQHRPRLGDAPGQLLGGHEDLDDHGPSAVQGDRTQ
ncbi:hypothetical protein [Planomonospora algeriensis]